VSEAAVGPERYYMVKNGYTFHPETGPALGPFKVFVAPISHVDGQTWKVVEITREEYLKRHVAQAEAEAPGRRRTKGRVVKKAPATTRMDSPPERPEPPEGRGLTGAVAKWPQPEPVAVAEQEDEGPSDAGAEEAPAPGRPAAEG
jgi:hypothetical protein